MTASFEAYMDLSTFTAKPPVPLPERPTALFVGMLEAYKNIDGLVEAWRKVVQEVPEAKLVLVGKGTRKHLVDGSWPSSRTPSSTSRSCSRTGSPSRWTVHRARAPVPLEGLGRVLVEAMARGRGSSPAASAGSRTSRGTVARPCW